MSIFGIDACNLALVSISRLQLADGSSIIVTRWASPALDLVIRHSDIVQLGVSTHEMRLSTATNTNKQMNAYYTLVLEFSYPSF